MFHGNCGAMARTGERGEGEHEALHANGSHRNADHPDGHQGRGTDGITREDATRAAQKHREVLQGVLQDSAEEVAALKEVQKEYDRLRECVAHPRLPCA